MVTPIWRVAGLDPGAVEIMIVQDNALNAFVAGGQRIFINTGLLLRTERPNQLIGVLAHETGHISGGSAARAHRRRWRSSARCRSSRRCSAPERWPAARSGAAGSGRPAPADAGGAISAGSLLTYLKYTQTQESSAKQAAISFLERTHQSVKGTIEFLRVLLREERLLIGRRDPYLSTHPLTPDRIEAFEEAAAPRPTPTRPSTPRFLDMHHRMVAKLMGFITPATPCSASGRRPRGAGR